MNKKLIIALIFALVLTAVLVPLTGCKDSGGNGNKVSEIYIAKSDLPRTEYVEGQELDISNGKLTAVVDGNTTKLPLTAPEVTVTGYNKDTIGEQTITVTYADHTTTFKVTVAERTVAEKYETKYFVGDTFKADKGKIKITTDDAKSFYVNMDDAKVSLVSFDSSKAGTSTVTLLYSDGTNSYYCQFDVTVYDKSNVEFIEPLKKDYLSHEDGLSINGGYFTVTSSDSTLTMNVPLTAEMVSGFDLSAATIANRTTPLEQTLTVTYLDKTFTYKVSIKFSGISAINYYVSETLSKINWADAKDNGLSEQQRSAAIAAINEYYELSDAHRALITDDAKATVARASALAVQDAFNTDVATYSETFYIGEEDGNIYFVKTTYEKTAANVERLNDPDSLINVYSKLLRKIKADFSDVIIVDDVTVGSKIIVYSEDMDTRFKEVLNHLVDVFALVKDIPAEWDAESLKPYGDSLLAAAMQIYNAGYYKSGYNTYYTNILSTWREKNDVFDILYTYFLYDYEGGEEFMSNYMWGSMPMPGLLEQWYMGVSGSIYYSNYYKNYGTSNAFLSDLTVFMYNYFYTLEICEQIKNSGNQFLIDIYNVYNGDQMNRTYMYTYSYGYLALTNAMIDSEAYMELWDKYYEVLKLYYDNSLSSETHKDQICAMFDAFEELDPTELLGFLSSLNLLYTNSKGALPVLGYTKGEDDEVGKVYNVFSYILSNGYSTYFNEGNKELFNDLLSAMESFVLITYKDGARDEFNTKMEALSKAIAALSEADRANFMEYCGKSYDKYYALYEVTSGKVTIELTESESALFEELRASLETYFVIYSNIYSILQQGQTVADDAYPVLYAFYARASVIRDQIFATVRPEALIAIYTKEFEIRSLMYDLEKAYYMADNITSSALMSMSAVLTGTNGATEYVTHWDLYVTLGFDKTFSDLADIFYSAFFTDGKKVEYSNFLAAMAIMREFTSLRSSTFSLMNADDTFYRALNVFYKNNLTEEGCAVGQSLIKAEKAYVLYSFNKSNEENRTAFVNAMEALVAEYEKLSDADKTYLSDMYNYYVKLLDEVKNATNEAA